MDERLYSKVASRVALADHIEKTLDVSLGRQRTVGCQTKLNSLNFKKLKLKTTKMPRSFLLKRFTRPMEWPEEGKNLSFSEKGMEILRYLVIGVGVMAITRP